uniref:Uncharacterized protein n=1 Tax=Haptolina ericina TaxID=156174 RepID=A0A7S3EVN8_9EUKA|mmetsp:Transcript_28106/g.63628  ORF Transcript_28106/g.63628 Transcript_28106/m.63628 type:complete len:122 (+) Transcript_28106:53-418(+)
MGRHAWQRSRAGDAARGGRVSGLPRRASSEAHAADGVRRCRRSAPYRGGLPRVNLSAELEPSWRRMALLELGAHGLWLVCAELRAVRLSLSCEATRAAQHQQHKRLYINMVAPQGQGCQNV